MIPAEESVSWRRAGHTYFTRTVPGRDYEQSCRAAGPGRPAQVLLDENLLLAEDPARGGYLGLGVREISPDGRLLAYSVDFDGDELYQLRIRDLARGTDLPERIEGTCYGLAWSADSRSLLYVVTTHSTGRTRSGGTCWAPARTATRWCSGRRTSGSRSPSGLPAAACTC